MFSGTHFDEGEGKKAETESGGDAEGERRGNESEERREGFAEIVPLDAGDGAAHESANEDESGSGGVYGNSGDERGAKHGEKKKSGDDEIAETGAGAGSYTSGAFDVTGDGGCAGERAEDGAEGVGKECATGAGEFAIDEEAAFFANADEGAHVIEEIDKEKNEDEFAKADFCGGAKIEFEECAGGMGQREEMVWPMGEAKRNSN